MSAAADKVAADAAKAKQDSDIKAAQEAAKVEAKSVEAERTAVRANLDDILVLRGLARVLSHPFATEKLGALFDDLADALVADEAIDEDVLVDVAIALKNKSHFEWDAMVKSIEDLLANAKAEVEKAKADKAAKKSK